MSTYKTTFVDKGGVIPWIDPLTNTATVTKEMVLERTDNPEALDHQGINNICIISFPGYWHIIQATGYTQDTGMFCLVF